LLVVAHPDDETIFFGGTMYSLKKRGWKVIVVTDGNADGMGSTRRNQLLARAKNSAPGMSSNGIFPTSMKNASTPKH